MRSEITPLINCLNEIILGKQHALTLALACVLAKGHLLLEDLPGMGKTTLAHALAKVLGVRFQRVQFTSDLLPADILGTAIYRRAEEKFTFSPGPIFTEVLLADEINRATPKTQSALLEAMEERQVTQDGRSHPLPEPFFVIATQNPSTQIGTFILPEAQVDRFLMRIELGYPDPLVEKELLQGVDRRQLIANLATSVTPAQVVAWQKDIESVVAREHVVTYVLALITYSREHLEHGWGLSPRAGLALLRAARAWAWIQGRDYVLPEDVQTVLPAIVAHRLQAQGADGGLAVRQMLQKVAVPV